ncbi:MAG: cytochrome c biosis protein CcmG [Actinomycetota bacterium]
MSDVPAQPSGPSRRRVAPFVVLAVAVVFVGFFWVLAGGDGQQADKLGLVDSPLLGRAAPTVRSTTLDDTPFDLSRRKGSWVVLNFFNSTCVPCRAEHPELVEFAEQQSSFGSDGAELYTVLQYQDQIDNVKKFFVARGGDWPIVRDDEGGINVDFAVAQVPETFVVNPAGVVVLRWAGPIDADTLSQLVQQQRDIFAATGGAG